MALGLLMAVAMYGQTYWDGTSNKTFGGSGTESDPYLISTPEQLAGLAERTNVDKEDFTGKYFKLTADIYLTNFNDPDTANWKQWEPIAHTLMQWGEETDYGYFRGTFDGQGHTIYGMYMERNGIPGWNTPGENVGLFGEVVDTATIRNVGVAASVLDGQNYNTRGQNNGATQYWHRCGCGEQGWSHVGMLIGLTTRSIIEQCYAEGYIYSQEEEGHAFIGEIDSYSSRHNDTISNCYSRVNIYNKRKEPEGLFAPSGGSATFINCYSAGVTKYGISGCAGSGYGTVTQNNTYYDKELSEAPTPCDGKGCTTNEMHAKATYKNWDFENIWGRNDTINDGYPYLRVFHENAPKTAKIRLL